MSTKKPWKGLDWCFEIDHRDDPMLVAASAYYDDGSQFEHRIKQVGKRWECFCTLEIRPTATFERLVDAMRACEGSEPDGPRKR